MTSADVSPPRCEIRRLPGPRWISTGRGEQRGSHVCDGGSALHRLPGGGRHHERSIDEFVAQAAVGLGVKIIPGEDPAGHESHRASFVCTSPSQLCKRSLSVLSTGGSAPAAQRGEGVMPTTEQQPYEVLQRYPGFELRRYRRTPRGRGGRHWTVRRGWQYRFPQPGPLHRWTQSGLAQGRHDRAGGAGNKTPEVTSSSWVS